MRWVLVLAIILTACHSHCGGRDDASIAKEIEAYVEQRVAVDQFSGSVVVMHHDKAIMSRAWGLASEAYHVPNHIDTKFNLGSMNKMFTAVSIMQLVEQRKVSLDDTIGKWLPDWPNQDAAAKVTVQMLLTHTSGLGHFWNKKFEQSKLHIRAIADYFPTFAADPLLFEPGARFSYSNSGFIVLGAIVEKASSEDYFHYVRDHVYAPAAMTDTDCYDLALDTPNLAVGYTWIDPEGHPDHTRRHNNVFLHVVKGGPAGGGYSTGPDLIKFGEALRTGKLVRPETFAEMTKPRAEGYGYGLAIDEVRGRKIVGHSGGFPGINSQLDVFLDGEWTIAVMSNYDGGAAPVAQFIRDLVTRP